MAHVTKHNREEEGECDDGKTELQSKAFLYVTKGALNVQASERFQVKTKKNVQFLKLLKDH